jgi:hypothetical protein
MTCADFLPVPTTVPGVPTASLVNEPTTVPATTQAWAVGSPAGAIASETSHELLVFEQTLPDEFRGKGNITLGFSYTVPYATYVKSYIAQPEHYYLREYVLWLESRQICWMSQLPGPLARTGTSAQVLTAILAPSTLDDATLVGDYADWLVHRAARQ